MRSNQSLHFILLIGILLTSSASLVAQTAEMLRHFDYDRKAPLGIKEIGLEHRGAVAIHDITYTSPKGGTTLPCAIASSFSTKRWPSLRRA